MTSGCLTEIKTKYNEKVGITRELRTGNLKVIGAAISYSTRSVARREGERDEITGPKSAPGLATESLSRLYGQIGGQIGGTGASRE